MTSIDDTAVDLATLARRLAAHFPTPPRGYVPGRTMMRDAVVDLLGCSAVDAEQLVAQLEGRRFVVYEGPTRSAVDTGAPWQFRT